MKVEHHQNESLPNCFSAFYSALEVICIYYICTVEVLCNDVVFSSISDVTLLGLNQPWWEYLTLETGKCCKLAG